MSRDRLPSFSRPKNLSSSERVLKTLRHEEPDIVPFDLGETRISGIHARAYEKYRERVGMPSHNYDLQIRYLQLPEINEDFRSFLEVDIESVDPRTVVRETETVNTGNGKEYTDMWGTRWLMPPGGNYFDINKCPLSEAETVRDIEDFNWPPGDDHRYFSHFSKELKRIKEESKRAVFLGRTSPGIFEMVQVLRGHERAFLDFGMNLEIAEAVMEKVLGHKMAYYKKVIEIMDENGINSYIVSESDDFGAQNGLLISPELYRSVIKPRHKELFSMIKRESGGKCFIELHCCGSIRELIPDLIDAGVEILNPVQVSADNMDTAGLKKDFGESIVFHGGGVDSQYTLPYGTPEEVSDEVKKHIEDLAPGGGFIFTPVHSVQHDVPFENFIAMIRTYREYA